MIDTDFVSLRDFMDLRFLNIERAVANFQSALEKVALEMVTRQQFERVVTEADLLRNKVDLLEGRLRHQEANMRIIKWIGGTVATVTVYLAVAYLRSLLGV